MSPSEAWATGSDILARYRQNSPVMGFATDSVSPDLARR
ncbi:hypothetical protein A2U01_0053892, partial [Trifolium medium]|nr:hypothetical protein [Trifolium medium]